MMHAGTDAPTPVKLLVGLLLTGAVPLDDVQQRLEERLGPVDFSSGSFPFDVTDYYEAEMGPDLSRVFFSFANLIDPADIVPIKLFTTTVENSFLEQGNRRVNIDPGYLDYHKLVLASYKYGGFKIYLAEGVYADMTLYYSKGTFHNFSWGFPDFKDGRYNAVLLDMRRRYKECLPRQGT